MTNRAEAKRRERARKAAGFRYISGYARTSEAEDIGSKLLTAAEVDREIEEKGGYSDKGVEP